MKLQANLNGGTTSSSKSNLSIICPCLCSHASLQKIHREHHFLCWRPVQIFLINLSPTALRNGWFKYLGEAFESTDCHQLIPQACVCTRLPQKRQKAKIDTTISDERWPFLIRPIKIPVLKREWAESFPGICSRRSEECGIQWNDK